MISVSPCWFIALCGDGEEGETVSLPGVGEVQRLDQPPMRKYLSVFVWFRQACVTR